MPTLQYDIAVVGMKNVESALSSIEKRFTRHNAAIMGSAARAANMPGMRSASRTAGKTGIDSETKAVISGFNQISRVGMIADRQRYRAQQRLESAAHREKLANVKAEARAALEAQREFRSRVGSTLGKAGSSLASIGKAGLAVTGIGGGALIASRLGGAMDLERRQRQVIINARGAGQANPLEYADLQKRIQNTATATGVSMEDITAGLETFVQRTGDLPQAVSYMDALSKASLATGSSMGDLAGVAADLQQKFDIKDPKEMADALAVLAMQGKKGAFELRDMATTFPELASAAQRVGMRGAAGMRTLGGLAQIARSATGSGEEASTALQAAFSQIVAKGGDLESGKMTGGRRVKVFADKGKTQVGDIASVIAGTIAGTHGNLTQLEKIFDIRGIRAVSPLISRFTEASTAAGGGTAGAEAGRKAVIAAINDAADAAGNFADLQRDAGDMQKAASVQLEQMLTELSAAVQKDVLPALVQLGPPLKKLLPSVAKGIELLAKGISELAEHPIAGIGAIIAAKVTADIAGAAIGDAIKNQLVNLIAGRATGGAGASGQATGGAGGGVGGALGLLALGATGFAIGAGLGSAAGADLTNPMLAAEQTTTDIAEGKLTDRAEMVRRRAELGTALQGMRAHGPGAMATVFGGVSKVLGGKSAGEMQSESVQSLTKAIDKLNAALDENTKATAGTAINRSNSPAVPKGAG